VCALLSCADNIMPLSWHMPLSKEPFRYAICVRDENYSHDLLHINQHFALNFLDYSYMSAYDTTGAIHGKGVDKFTLAKLTRKKAEKIRTTLIEESYMIYECKVIDILNYGDHDVFVADVVCIHNKNSIEVAPTLFLGGGYYDTTTQNPKRRQRE
ncbi:MAG: flavin reductase family protein, partial [Sulfurimonas sp.]|nr:flavin reductase family protein [Sulfurimonas sp.]